MIVMPLLCVCYVIIKNCAANFFTMYTCKFKKQLTFCLSLWGVDNNVYVHFYSVNVEVKSVVCTVWFKTYYLQNIYSYHLLNETVSLEDTVISLHTPILSTNSSMKTSNLEGGNLGKFLSSSKSSVRNSSWRELGRIFLAWQAYYFFYF